MKRFIRKLLVEHSVTLTVFFTVLALLGIWASRGIELKLSLTDLLPQDHPNVKKFNKLTEVVGGVGFNEILLHAEDQKSHLAVAPLIIEKLKLSPLVRGAFYQREEHFFLTHALYYMELPKLKELSESIPKKITSAKRKFFDIGLWDEDKKAEEKDVTNDEDLQKLAQRFAKMSPYLLSPDGKDLLVMVKPSFDSLDMGKNKEIVKFTEEMLRKNLPPNVTFKMSGRYYSKVRDADLMEKDMAILGVLSNVVMALILFYYFRSITAVISIFIPVVLGLSITALFTKIFIGHINIITGFLIGIISGIGSDYGIHMLWRLRLEIHEPSGSDPDPLWRTLATSGWANFVTIVSTGLCFFFMCGSSLKVFSEFGFVCGVGLTAILISKLGSFYCTSKLLRLEKIGDKKLPFSDRNLPILSSVRGFWTVLIFTFIVALMSSRVGFEFDFSKMMDHSKDVRETGRLVDLIYDRSTVPSAFAAFTREDAVGVENYIKENYVPNIVSSMVSGATLVPENQDQKLPYVKKIKVELAKISDKLIEKGTGMPAKTIRTWIDSKPFAFQDLPSYIRETLRGANENTFLIYVYPAEHLNTGAAVDRFAKMINEVGVKFPNTLVGSDAGIFNDILELIKRDGLVLLSLIFVFVGVFIFVTLRSLKEAFYCYVPFLLSMPVFIGMMGITGVKFNIFNVALLPAFIAVGIEIPIQLMQRTREIHSGFRAVRDIAVSLQLSLLTTAIGFGTLVFTRAGVLKSLGTISLMATAAIWIVGVFLQPAILERVFRESGSSPAQLDGEPVSPKY
ncbi:MAG: hypothetical protein FJ112_09090 [Deltaproteobacteria bacterium]|nr:hypothetical protein [Deltaproteobacteria bacterium]